MTMLIIPGKATADHWIKTLHKIDSSLKIQVWPKVADAKAVEFALVWNYPPGELAKFPNLKCISSLGAGVDHIINDPQRPQNIPVVRIVDQNLIRDMSQYVVWAVLNHVRQFDSYVLSQARHLWTPHLPQPMQIGIMGLGHLGADVAVKLRDLGLNVASWSRSEKNISGITHYAGASQLNDFLHHTDVLICLLPLTEKTQGILNLDLFKRLRRGAYIINVARGAHLVDNDLITAIDSGQLSGACIDVFHAEPLAANHPFWQHPKIKITPHIASVTNPETVAKQVIENYHRAVNDQPLLNQIDVTKGY